VTNPSAQAFGAMVRRESTPGARTSSPGPRCPVGQRQLERVVAVVDTVGDAVGIGAEEDVGHGEPGARGRYDRGAGGLHRVGDRRHADRGQVLIEGAVDRQGGPDGGDHRGVRMPTNELATKTTGMRTAVSATPTIR